MLTKLRGPSCTRRLLFLSVFFLVLEGGCKPKFKPVEHLRARSANETPADMVLIPGGSFSMGSTDEMFTDAQPVHAVRISPFFVDKTEVTNAAFTKFVEATGYVTVAERTPRPQDFPGVRKEDLVAGSVVFAPPDKSVSLTDHLQWWTYKASANWRHPEGPATGLDQRQDHPVVHVAWRDAAAYCAWAGKRLPSEAEWEYAARGGLPEKRFAWGDLVPKPGNWRANVWQGNFPEANTAEDGYRGTAPVGKFAPNGYGLHDVAGNVWEWCNDFYRADYYQRSPSSNPPGPADSFDPDEPRVVKRVQRGGSFVCSERYCVRYVVGARGKGEPDTGSSHVGFRCALGSGTSS